MPVIPATWEGEAGESLESRRWRLQSAEIVPLPSSLGNRLRFHLKIKKKSALDRNCDGSLTIFASQSTHPMRGSREGHAGEQGQGVGKVCI